MFIYALQYSTTAYTGLIPVVAIPMNHPGFHKISGCHWLWRPSLGYGGHRPPQAPEAVETVDAEQDSQGNSNSGEVATR